MENLKMDLMDAIEDNSSKLREIQKNDEILMGAGLILFVLSLSLLSLQEFNRLQLQREIEKQALNLLKAGQANVGAIVDQIVDRALVSQNMPVTAQIFKDYHGQILERMTTKSSSDRAPKADKIHKAEKVEVAAQVPVKKVEAEVAENVFVAPAMKAADETTSPDSEIMDMAMPKASLKEGLVSIQKLHGKENMQISDVRDVQLRVDSEALEQMLNAAVSKLMSQRQDNKKIMISNQIHSDRSIINMFIGNAAFRASELEFASTTAGIVAGNEMDMNLVILKEIAESTEVSWHIENKTDKNGNITGMNIRLVANRVPKESRAKNLISVMKGKKRDLSRELAN